MHALQPQEVETLRRSVERLALLLDLSQDLASELDLDRLLRKIMQRATEVLNADRSTLFLVDYAHDQLWSRVAQGQGISEIRIPRSAGIAGHVATTGETLNIPDAYQDPRFNQEVDRRTGYRTRTILCMPLRDKEGRIVGVLQSLNKQGGPFTIEDEELVRAVSAHVAVALQNASLFEEVVRVKNYNESVLKSMATGVVTLDSAGVIRTSNPAAQRILGFPDGLPVGSPFGALVGTERNREVWHVARDTLERGESRRAEKLRYHALDGSPVTMNVSAVPLRDHKEAQIGLVLVMEDISREQQLVGTLSRVVSRQVAEQIIATGGMPSVGGQRKEVTVLMSDIRDFTTMSEQAEPEEIVAMLNAYFGRMIEVIFQYEGTLDKFIGDAIMAVFGTPMAHRDDPLRAVRAAIDMRRALRAFNEERRAEGKPTIEIGVGICNGEVISGGIGSEERLEFTVIGDTVNTASRLEGLTKGYPAHKILFNEPVYELVKDHVPCEFLAEEKVKGKVLPVRIFGVPETVVHGRGSGRRGRGL